MKTLLLSILLSISISLQAGIGEGQSEVGPLPVELISFSASVKDDVVLLSWTTATEVNNYGFEIARLRSTKQNSAEASWETLGFVEGHGNSNSPKDYTFIDSDITVAERSRSYRLKQIDTDGKFAYSEIIELKSNLSKKYILEQNYPNPFNPTTVISYSIPNASYVAVKVFDVLGKEVSTLVNKNQESGSYKVLFNATELSNGVYFYKIQSGNFIEVKKMLLLK